MKIKILLTACLISFFSVTLFGQWSNKSFTFEGKNRQYRIYIPSCYNPANPAALVIALHGLGDNMTNFSGIGMHPIADTANFIFVVPQAWADAFAGNAWNSGAGAYGYYPNSTVNDVGFINALVDTTAANYSLDPLRIYLMGFSMGGFMTQRMACQSNGKFAAFASFSGTRGNGLASCNPNRAVPILHAHGTNDSTVYYTGNLYGLDAEELVNFWVVNNQCDTSAAYTELPNTVNDGDTVEHYVYQNGQMNSIVEFYRVRGGGHNWLYKPANDISYSAEVWRFFSQYVNNVYGVNALSGYFTGISAYPNPATDHLFIQFPEYTAGENTFFQLFDMRGAMLLKGMISQGLTRVSLTGSSIHNGIYLLRIYNESGQTTRRVVIAR